METPTIQAGAPLQVNVTVTNISDNDVNVSDAVSSMTGQHNNYLLEVLDEWAIKRRNARLSTRNSPAGKRFCVR